MSRKDRRAGRVQGGVSPSGGAPPSADRLFDLAVDHHNAGRLAQAETLYRDSLALDPDHADSLNCLGILAHQCGRSDAALELIGRAIALNDREAQYHYNIGLVSAALGRMEEAVTHNRRAVELMPDHADAHTNLGGALAAQGRWSEAELHFRRALSRRPESAVAYGNLAGALRAQGKPEEALGVVTRGLAVGESDELKAVFALCIRDLRSVPKIDKLRMYVERAMAQGWTRSSDLAFVASALVKQSEPIRVAVERTECWPRRVTAQELFGPQGLAVPAGDTLLGCLLESTPVCDIGLERLLTNVRRALLDLAAADGKSAPEEVLNFCAALARQCFINEYVFDGSEEMARATAMRDVLAAALKSGEPVPALVVTAVASYVPLHSLAGAQGLLDRNWPDAVSRLVVQQVREPAQERQLRASIPALTTIAPGEPPRVGPDDEENPHPRWIGAGAPAQRLTFDEYIRTQFPRVVSRPLGKTEVDMLIAGCGTGRRAVETARWCAGANILAVDRNLASLAYAKRKTQEAGIGNIEYAQADILELDAIGRMFDVVDAVGVLHRLADPVRGWRVLLPLLRPGGFMHFGLYRASLRRDIDAARVFIAERGFDPTADGIRRCRQAIMGLDAGAPAKGVVNHSDFFAISECRDLLFQVQDHRSEIPWIKAFLAENDLVFVGFEGAAFSEYAERYPGDPSMTDLDNWHALEAERPAIFAGMYQFWLQKPMPTSAAD